MPGDRVIFESCARYFIRATPASRTGFHARHALSILLRLMLGRNVTRGRLTCNLRRHLHFKFQEGAARHACYRFIYEMLFMPAMGVADILPMSVWGFSRRRL